MEGIRGAAPRFTGSKPVVLLLDDIPMIFHENYLLYVKFFSGKLTTFPEIFVTKNDLYDAHGGEQRTCTPTPFEGQSAFKAVPVRLSGLFSLYTGGRCRSRTCVAVTPHPFPREPIRPLWQSSKHWRKSEDLNPKVLPSIRFRGDPGTPAQFNFQTDAARRVQSGPPSAT